MPKITVFVTNDQIQIKCIQTWCANNGIIMSFPLQMTMSAVVGYVALTFYGLDVLSILMLFTSVLIAVKLTLTYKDSVKLPPGPWGFPLLGHLPLLGKDILGTFEKFRKQYGDVYQIRFGKWPTVVINGKAAIKEALYKRGDAFNGRPEFTTVKLVSNMKGVGFSHFDDRYLMHRKIAGSVLKMFIGNGNEIIQEIIESEAKYLVKDFLNQKGIPFDPNDAMFLSAGSVIFQVVYGRGKNIREEEDFVWFVKNTEAFKDFVKAGNPFDVMPWMRFILPKKYNAFKNIIERTALARERKLQEISQTYKNDEIRHAVDGLLAATKQYSSDDKDKVGITDWDILNTTFDYLGAGFDTTATNLLWAVLHLANNPTIQLKAQSELDSIIGLSRQPSFMDRPSLPYIEAIITEVLRMGSVAPLALPHYTLEDTELQGYFIPKGTVAFLNLHSANYDSKMWESPYKFKPERFLDKYGQLNKERVDSVIAFGAGRRRCLGEQLARMETFMFITFLLQRCRIIKPSCEEYDIKGEVSLSHQPKPYQILVLPRD